MKPSEIFKLKEELLETFKQLLPVSSYDDSSASLESALASHPDIKRRAFVGYTLAPNETDQYRLVVQVPRKTGPSFSTAQDFVRDHQDSAILAVTESLNIPNRGDTASATRHEGLSKRLDTICIGSSVSHADGDPGTLTGFGRLHGEEVLISANHVIACSNEAGPGTDIYQPAKADYRHHEGVTASNYEIVGKLRKWIPIGKTENEVDCADAILDLGQRTHHGNYAPPSEIVPSKVANQYIGIHREARTIEQKLPLLGKRVGKFGRSTGYTEGTVLSVFEEILITYPTPKIGNAVVAGLICIRWDNEGPLTPFTKPGDSGACVFLLDTLEGIGLHMASSKSYEHDGSNIGVSFACYLPTVLRSLGVTWAPKDRR